MGLDLVLYFPERHELESHSVSQEKDRAIPPGLLSAYFRKLGAKGGKIGGKRTAANLSAAQRKTKAQKAGKANLVRLTPRQRKMRAKLAAEARWKKAREAKAAAAIR